MLRTYIQIELGNCMIDLGAAYAEAGRRAEARNMYEEGLKVLKANTISDHPNILMGMQNLAVLDHAEGNTAAAAARFEVILPVRKLRLGLEHPETLQTIRDLAFCYGKLGRITEAEALYRESLEIARKLGARNPDRTIRSLTSLGNFYEERNRFGEAEPFFREALQLARKALTNDAPAIEGRVRDLAYSLYGQGKYAEAEPLYREAIQSQVSRYPTNHDNILGTQASLARLLADWAWDDQARSLKPVTGVRKFTSKPEASGGIVSSAAPSPWHRAVEAEQLLRKCVELRAVDKRVSHGRLGDTKSRLGAAVLSVAFTQTDLSEEQRLIKLDEAEMFLLAGQELMEKSTSIETKYKRDGIQRLVRLYNAWPKAAEAAEWKRKLDVFDQEEARKKPATAMEAPE
jgi:tetratricopeptide (TPR) repeat protein